MPDEERIETLLASCTLAGPADEEMIQSAEAKLGVRLPQSYRAFLARYGAALCRGFEIAGLFRDTSSVEPPLWSDVVTKTVQMRRGSGGRIPAGYVAISDDGGDYTYYLDTGRIIAGTECPVIVLGPGADGLTVARDFLDFVARAANGSLSF